MSIAAEIGEVWDGRHYDPKFFYQLADYAKSQGDAAKEALYRGIAEKWDVAWGLAYFFGKLHGKGVSSARVAFPPIHMNRHARRLVAAAGRSTKLAKKIGRALSRG